MSKILDLFVQLTQYTIPFKRESTLEKYLPKGFKKDAFGNYIYEIGQSETLFTTHLDSYDERSNKVHHIFYDIEGKSIEATEKDKIAYIGTDHTTILGGDNKAGVCVLINMIENNIPGVYYFFVGEEPILSGGLWGSKNAFHSTPDYFKKFKRAIAFDRKAKGSIITRQSAQACCSPEFTDVLINEFGRQGLPFEADPTGYYTDTASFLTVIPECTNISVGVYNEHTEQEFLDLKYLELICDAALKIDWEKLPSVRSTEPTYDKKPNREFSKEFFRSSHKSYNVIRKLLEEYGFLCLNSDDFEPEHTMIFSQWHNEIEMKLQFSENDVIINGHKLTVNQFIEGIQINEEEALEEDKSDEAKAEQ